MKSGPGTGDRGPERADGSSFAAVASNSRLAEVGSTLMPVPGPRSSAPSP